MIRPLTISECREQLTATHDLYLKAERRGEMFDAGRLYAELDELLDIFQHLPQQRTSPENGESTCVTPSPTSAPTPSP